MCEGTNGVSEEGSISIQANGPGVEDSVKNEERQENEESNQGKDSSK